MTPQTKLLLSVVGGLTACGATQEREGTASSGTTKKGGGSLVYRDVELRLVDQHGSQLVAAGPGFARPELLSRSESNTYSSSFLSPRDTTPGCENTALLAVPGFGEGGSEVWVHDPCGNWITDVTGHDNADFTSAQTLLALGPQYYAELLELPDQPVRVVVSGSSDNFTSLSSSQDSPTWEQAAWQAAAQPLDVRVTRPFVYFPTGLGGSDEPLLVAHHREQLEVFALNTAGDLGPGAILTQLVTPPLVRAYSGFDHFQPVIPTGCAPFGLGVGLFPAHAGASPRYLQRIDFPSLDLPYEVRDVMTEEEISTFAVISVDNQTFVGMLTRSESATSLLLHRAEGCGELIGVGRAVIDWPTPTSVIAASTSNRMTAFESELGVEFAAYDGNDLFRFVIRPEREPFEIEASVETLHEN